MDAAERELGGLSTFFPIVPINSTKRYYQIFEDVEGEQGLGAGSILYAR